MADSNHPGVESAKSGVSPAQRQTGPNSAAGESHASADSPLGSIQSNLKEAAQSTKAAAIQAGEQKFDQTKDAINEQLEQAQETADSVAASLRDGNQQTLAQYTSSLSEKIGAFAGGLQHRSAQDVIQEVVHVAKRNPAMFIAGSVVAGFALARYISASSNGGQESQAVAGIDDVASESAQHAPQTSSSIYSAPPGDPLSRSPVRPGANTDLYGGASASSSPRAGMPSSSGVIK